MTFCCGLTTANTTAPLSGKEKLLADAEQPEPEWYRSLAGQASAEAMGGRASMLLQPPRGQRATAPGGGEHIHVQQ